jgi:hypothetical protein
MPGAMSWEDIIAPGKTFSKPRHQQDCIKSEAFDSKQLCLDYAVFHSGL